MNVDKFVMKHETFSVVGSVVSPVYYCLTINMREDGRDVCHVDELPGCLTVFDIRCLNNTLVFTASL